MPPAEVLTPRLLRSWPLPAHRDGEDKHARGTVLVVGGSAATPGAVLLAGLAALRVGAGRLQIVTVPETAVALGVALPEALVVGSDDLGSCSLAQADAVLVGPGLDDPGPVLKGLLPRLEGRQLVVDAKALTVLEGALPGGVLTPNMGELHALGGEGEAPELPARVSRERQAVVATHGWVAAPDGRLWRNASGGVGLGTSGSGDVLAGAVIGLLARGADPAQAACWGEYLHSAAGDRLAAAQGRVGFLARELLDELTKVMAGLS
jgi:ADP-dependent NAD(P)H-hydrate dehydratase